MNKMFDRFSKPSRQEWVDLLKKELKGADFESNLLKHDEVEELDFLGFHHQDDLKLNSEIPGTYPYKRGNSFQTSVDGWAIVSEIEVQTEKKANENALNLLNSGTNALVFDVSKCENLNLKTLVQDIGLEYIKVYFKVSSGHQIHEIQLALAEKKKSEIIYLWNPLSKNNKLDVDFLQFPAGEKSITRIFDVDAYSVQQAGANASQELAFALSLGHEYLIQQINSGKSADEALLSMHFTLGVGSSYFFELAKFRAFRMLWAKIARAYKPQHTCNEIASVTAKTGFYNKSLFDPYTNLLRQTTEVMSALIGGVEQIWVQPYDACSVNGSSGFAQRMATNISLILKEESYFSHVLDPAGGSYALEFLTEKLADKAWSLFQQTEQQGGVFSDFLSDKIRKTNAIRIKRYQDKEQTLIGVNKYPNPEKIKNEWEQTSETYFGLNPTIIENELIKITG